MENNDPIFKFKKISSMSLEIDDTLFTAQLRAEKKQKLL